MGRGARRFLIQPHALLAEDFFSVFDHSRLEAEVKAGLPELPWSQVW